MNGRTHVNIVVLGNPRSGKSTAVDHLMHRRGAAVAAAPDPNRLPRVPDTGVPEAGEGGGARGDASNDPWALSAMVARMDRGEPVDMKLWNFDALTRTVTVIDAPGHRQFIRNLITGVSQPHGAVLFVSAVQGEFESALAAEDGESGTTYLHALLAFTLGLKQLVVAINKMDAVDFSEERYNAVVPKVKDALAKVGYNPEDVIFVPISALNRDNLVDPSPRMAWFRGWTKGEASGMTLLEAMDRVEPPVPPVDRPLRLPLQDVYKIDQIGTVPVGKVEAGKIRAGMKVKFAPSGLVGEVVRVEKEHTVVEQGIPGDSVGFPVTEISVKDIRRGYVCSDAENCPAKTAASFVAQIIVIYHPNTIVPSYTPVLDCHSAHVSCRFEQLIHKIDQRTGVVIEANPKFLKQGDSATVKLTPLAPICVEPFVEFPFLGRFAIRDKNQTVAIGIIKSVEFAEP